MNNPEIITPQHKHPHGINDTQPNENRIWVCEECNHIFIDEEAKTESKEYWGHPCKQHPCRKNQRCESHLEPYLPELGNKQNEYNN